MTDTQTNSVEESVGEAEFAFVVLKQKDGRFAIANINKDSIVRQPTMEDVLSAMHAVATDINRQQTAVAVVGLLQQMQGQTGGFQQPNAAPVEPEARFVKRAAKAEDVTE